MASSWLHWVARGAGSGLRGHELVDAIVGIGRHVPALSAARLTVLWYVVPAFGALSWIALGVAGVRARAAKIVALLALVASVLVGAAFVRLVEIDDLGPGPLLAVCGALTLVVAAFGSSPLNGRRSADR
jgi:predicted benzoate:H+ symporter BenE